MSSKKLHNQHRSNLQTSSDAPKPPDSNIIVIPSNPRVVVLPGTSDQLPSLAISVLALLVSLYVLRKTLAQKRNEYAARFFHEVVLDNVIEPTLDVYKSLRLFTETRPQQIARVPEGPEKDQKIRQAMREVRDSKRQAAQNIASLAAPFSIELERKIQQCLDNIADKVELWIERYICKEATYEEISIDLANSQTQIIRLLMEHEFRIAWPTLSHRLRGWVRSLKKWFSNTLG